METLFDYSKESIDLLQSKDLILKKNALLEKLEQQLLLLGKESAKNNDELAEISPLLKVSKGENHQGLPFLVLDYPRIFSKAHIFAIRCLIWWGKQVSVSLLLKGKYLEKALPRINANITTNNYQNFYVETQGSPWQHELLEEDQNTKNKIKAEVDFLKISSKMPIAELNDLSSFYKESFDKLLKLCSYETN